MVSLKLDPHEVAAVLEEIASLLEFKDENPFKVRAYLNAARLLDGLGEDFTELVEEDRLKDLKGIGASLNEQILSLAKTGKLALWEKLKGEFPETLLELLRVPGLGPKKVKILHDKLGVGSLGELEYACHENRLLKLEGFGEKTQAKVLAGIEYLKKNQRSFLFASIADAAGAIAGAMERWPEVRRVSVAGSLRRRKEIVRDVDIVCSSSSPGKVMKKFLALGDAADVIADGETRMSVRLKNGLQVDLRVVTDLEFPAALLYFTGSMEHNTALRALAKEKGFKLNEYGLFRGEKPVGCADEKEIFRALGLHYVPPELRENLGEIEAAARGPFPELLDGGDIRGLLHVHTTYSDGRNTLEEMLVAAREIGLEYIGISDHSQTAAYAHGLKEADIDRQHREMDELEKKFRKLRIFRGIESDILPDGSLDYPERVLRKFDFVIGSVHAKFNMTEEDMTTRCLKALENPRCTMLGHPTGRLLLAREGFKVNLPQLIDRASALGKLVELNANPQRLDLDWRFLPKARERGVLVSINPDAHDCEGLRDVRFGVNTARKAGFTKADVLNSLPASQVEKVLEKART